MTGIAAYLRQHVKEARRDVAATDAYADKKFSEARSILKGVSLAPPGVPERPATPSAGKAAGICVSLEAHARVNEILEARGWNREPDLRLRGRWRQSVRYDIGSALLPHPSMTCRPPDTGGARPRIPPPASPRPRVPFGRHGIDRLLPDIGDAGLRRLIDRELSTARRGAGGPRQKSVSSGGGGRPTISATDKEVADRLMRRAGLHHPTSGLALRVAEILVATVPGAIDHVDMLGFGISDPQLRALVGRECLTAREAAGLPGLPSYEKGLVRTRESAHPVDGKVIDEMMARAHRHPASPDLPLRMGQALAATVPGALLHMAANEKDHPVFRLPEACHARRLPRYPGANGRQAPD